MTVPIRFAAPWFRYGAGDRRIGGACPDVRHSAQEEETAMIRLFVRHNVEAYETWRAVYDDFDATRRSMGVTGHAVYRNVDDGNDITAYHDFATLDAARAFAGSSQLREAMGKAGVAGAPQIWFTEEA
jgi:hypothetical protein